MNKRFLPFAAWFSLLSLTVTNAAAGGIGTDQQEARSTSPDGKLKAFVHKGNLYVVDAKDKDKKERQLTKDGTDLILNGKAAWVYYEEIFHRKYKAYWWSPDSRHLAFLQFDERKVPKIPIHHAVPQGRDQFIEQMTYPRAGEANPTVKLGLVPVDGGAIVWVDLKAYGKEPILVIRAGWLPDSKTAYFYVQDRAQTWLDVCTVPATGGEPTKLLRDTTKAWVEDPDALKFLKDGSFLLYSERSGYKHLYHYDPRGKLIRPVTTGPWEIRALHLLEERTGWVYFSATKDGHLGSNLYRVKLDGTELTRLTQGGGTHDVRVDANGEVFTDTWSDRNTPPQVRQYKTDGTLVKVIDDKPAKQKPNTGKVEFVEIPTPDGFTLDGIVIKPPKFDATKKYPVWFTTYGGPHAPTIKDTWAGGRVADHAKAAQGYIVFYCDPRSASGRGAVATWSAYRQLGVQELKDIETAVKWLTKHPWADADRVGFTGYSYGGFMVAYAMTHSKLFAAGIAGAPVTDWRHYDSIYTERYMNTPQENPNGYEATSVVKAAKHLHGKLLLVHGLIDDNVHARNTIQLANELQKADRDFEMMIYPPYRHGVYSPHFQRLSMEFMRRHLRPVPAGK